MDKVICWRRHLQQNDYLLLVLANSIDAAKKTSREAGISGPRKSELVGMELTDPELSDVTVEPGVLYIADEEVSPIKFQRFELPTGRPHDKG